MNKKLLIFIALWAIVSPLSSDPIRKVVKLSGFVPKDSARFFKNGAPFLCGDNQGYAYALSNRENSITKYSLYEVGQKGLSPKGVNPPVLIYPHCLAYYEGKIVISDHASIHILNAETVTELSKFRKFVPTISIALSKDMVIVLEAGNDDSIVLYDYSGKRLSSFRHKYDIDYSRFPGWDPVTVDTLAGAGKIFWDGRKIHLVSFLFGEVSVFDASGTLLLRGTIGDQKNHEQNRRRFFTDGIKNVNSTFPILDIFSDAVLVGDRIYLLVNSLSGRHEIWEYDIESDQVVSVIEYSLSGYRDDIQNVIPRNLAVDTSRGPLTLIISFFDKIGKEASIGLFN